MNERIKELAEQAHCYSGGHSLLCHENDIKKFAELIVKEMCQVINADCDRQWNDGVIANLGGLNQARELIKQHFGVEE